MILTVTLNPALDVTYEVERLERNQSHRVLTTHSRAGGKGINVARALTALGKRAVVTGLAGGAAGAELRAELAAVGLVDEMVVVRGQSRRTVAVVSREEHDATVFNEPGPPITTAEWDEFTRRFDDLAQEAELVVLSGSLPPGVPGDGYAQLVRAASAHGRPTILDAAGSALTEALEAGPTVIKPNAAELAAATEMMIAADETRSPDSDSGLAADPEFAPAPNPACDPAPAAALLRERGATNVVVSLGPRGLYALTPSGAWRAVAPVQAVGNPTGAGDACVAAIAAGLAAGADWPEILREAAALSAATVLSPVAGSFDAEAYQQFRTAISVEDVHAAHSDR